MIILTTILYLLLDSSSIFNLYLTSRIEVDYNLNYYLLIYPLFYTTYYLLRGYTTQYGPMALWSTSNSIIYNYMYIIASKGGYRVR